MWSASPVILVCYLLFCRKRLYYKLFFTFTINKPAWDWSLVAKVVPNVSLQLRSEGEILAMKKPVVKQVKEIMSV